jgi:general secretion pathway protein D
MRRSGTSLTRAAFVAAISASLLAAGAGRAQAAPSATPPVEESAKMGPAASLVPQETSDHDMLDSVERVRHVMQQALAAEVHRVIQEARERMVADPDGIKKSLALTHEHVRVAPELEAAQRDQLLSQIAAASRSAARLSSISAERENARQEILAEQYARRELNQERLAKQQLTADRLARVNSLTSGGQFRDAEDAARQIASKDPGTVAGTTAALEATMRANISDIQSLAERRRQGLVEAFRAEDAQHAENLGAEPIVYPSAVKWLALSERRKEWRENASAYRPSAGEAKINQALKETTSIDFQNEPLADVIDYLKAKHGIEIQLDNQALTDAAIGPSAPVTRSAKGIRLRSALRLLLDDLGLTWVVHDDVLMITTKERADTDLTTRVYDVADLVLPIPNPFQNGTGGNGFRGGRFGGNGFHGFRLPGRMAF